jgi:iron complex transport system permease protein
MSDQQKLLIRDRRDSIASHPSLAHVELVNGSQSATHRRRTSWPGSALQTDSQEPETPAVLTDQSLDSEHSDDEIISERSETRDKEQTHALAHGASDSTKRRKRTRKRMSLRFTIMVGALLAIIIVSFAVGWYGISPGTIIKFFWSLIFPSGTVFPQEIHTVLINIRLPRIALGLLVGSGLAVAGHTFQGVFRNPMASPDVLGASSGAGFGAALAILWGYSATGITAMSFVFGLVSIGLVLVLTSFVRSQRTLSLILTGIVVGSLFSAGLSFIKFVADPTDQLPAITYWLMGSLNSSQLKQLTFAAPPILAGLLVIILLRWQLNVLMFGEEAASTMGVRTRLIRIVLIIAATLITATCVSVSGIIGWVGLVVPHIARMITGTDNRLSLPASALIGSGFLIFVDDIARRATTSGIPLGILTAFVGAPFFIFLILRQGRRDVAA